MTRLGKLGIAGMWAAGFAAALAGSAIWILFGRQGPMMQEQAVAAASTPGSASKARDRSNPSAKSSRQSRPGAEGADASTSVGATPASGEYADPQAIAHRFSAELTRLAKQGKAPTPVELFQQAEKAKTCAVVPLPDPGQKLSPEAIYARARLSVVVVGAVFQSKSQRHKHAALATGFVIHKDGVIVTNYHVLEAFQHSRAVGVMTEDGRVLAVKSVLAADSLTDLAVIQADAADLAPLPIAASVPVGAAVYCLSHPSLDTEETETGFYTFTQGIVCGKFRLRVTDPTPVDVLAITAEYAKGSSGGPILNEHGAVVGIICQTRALFHDEDESEPQLTWKFSRPSSSLLALLQPAGKAK
jgi:serine protease Do